jgi:hypothetical protein
MSALACCRYSRVPHLFTATIDCHNSLMTVSSPLPLALYTVLRGLERTYLEEDVGSPAVPALDLWANLLRVIDAAGIDRRKLPVLLRLSVRAVRTRVSTAVRRDWVEELKSDQNGRIVRLTSYGSVLAVRCKNLLQSAEDVWQTKVGLHVSNQLRTALEDLVAAFPLEHPHYPASYGLADARITGGNGVDWTPVYRTGTNTVSHLSLSALLSQALVAFAMQYEELSPVALSLSADVIRQIPAEGRPLQELGRSPGVSALIRHGFIRVSGSRGREIALLTKNGLKVHGEYEKRIHTVATSWQRQFGKHRVAALIFALEEARVSRHFEPCEIMSTKSPSPKSRRGQT